MCDTATFIKNVFQKKTANSTKQKPRCYCTHLTLSIFRVSTDSLAMVCCTAASDLPPLAKEKRWTLRGLFTVLGLWLLSRSFQNFERCPQPQPSSVGSGRVSEEKLLLKEEQEVGYLGIT